MTIFSSSIDISQHIRTAMIALLSQQLADTFDLQSQVKQAHWNVKGPQFLELHEFFDEVAKTLSDEVDTIAERITAFGGTALGTVRAAAAKSSLPELPATFESSMKAVEVVALRVSKLAASTRAAIDTADKAGDKGTADLFTAMSRELDKTLWFLEAHLQSK